MGDRAHIVVKGDGSKVFLYTHWEGSNIADVVKAALKRVPGRWQDVAYLTRAMFCQFFDGIPEDRLSNELLSETGFGIASRPCEDTSRDIVVDVDKQTVKLPRKTAVSFAEFVK